MTGVQLSEGVISKRVCWGTDQSLRSIKAQITIWLAVSLTKLIKYNFSGLYRLPRKLITQFVFITESQAAKH